MTLAMTSAESLSPVHLAYLAAAVLLPLRLLVALRLSREVPRLHARVREMLESGEADVDAPLRRSSNPYADLARLLLGTARAERPAPELDAALERAMRKTRQRTVRGQALDAASLLLLLGLLLTQGQETALEREGPWGMGWIGLMLLATIFVRASLQQRLQDALFDLADRLRQRPPRSSGAGVCAFCGSTVESAAIEIALDGANTRAVGMLCRNCGKLVASMKIARTSL